MKKKAGFDCPIPSKEEYQELVNELVSRLEQENVFTNHSLLVYGSFLRGTHVPGISDIDGLFVFPDDVVIDKERFLLFTKIFSEVDQATTIRLQIKPYDMRTLIDGRFSTFGEDFGEYFSRERHILLGEDFTQNMQYFNQITHNSHYIAKNLRNSRMMFIGIEQQQEEDYRGFLDTLDAVCDMSLGVTKRIKLLMTNRVSDEKLSCLDFVGEKFPEVDLAPLRRIGNFRSNPQEYFALFRKPEEYKALALNCLTAQEEIIRAYISAHPVNKKN